MAVKPYLFAGTFRKLAHLTDMTEAALKAVAEGPSDSELVARVRQGDGRAFALIMRRNNRRLFRLVRAVVGNDFEAEEMVQEAYVRGFAALASWREEASLSTWLSRIALNEALAYVRRRREMVELDEIARLPLSAEVAPSAALFQPSPEADAARTEIRHLLERAVDRLPPAFRAAFVLRAVEQLSVEETAAILEVPAETVRTRFFRARGLLQKDLGRKLASVLEDSFPFDGARCDRVIDKVLRRLAIAPAAERD